MKKVAKFEKIPESEIVNESEEIKLYYKDMWPLILDSKAIE